MIFSNGFSISWHVVLKTVENRLEIFDSSSNYTLQVYYFADFANIIAVLADIDLSHLFFYLFHFLRIIYVVFLTNFIDPEEKSVNT